jgi:hypothetical protein
MEKGRVRATLEKETTCQSILLYTNRVLFNLDFFERRRKLLMDVRFVDGKSLQLFDTFVNRNHFGFFFFKVRQGCFVYLKNKIKERGGFISQESTKRDEVVAAAANDRYTCVKIQGHLVSEKKLPSVLAVIITLASNEKKIEKTSGIDSPRQPTLFLILKI